MLGQSKFVFASLHCFEGLNVCLRCPCVTESCPMLEFSMQRPCQKGGGMPYSKNPAPDFLLQIYLQGNICKGSLCVSFTLEPYRTRSPFLGLFMMMNKGLWWAASGIPVGQTVGFYLPDCLKASFPLESRPFALVSTVAVP